MELASSDEPRPCSTPAPERKDRVTQRDKALGEVPAIPADDREQEEDDRDNAPKEHAAGDHADGRERVRTEVALPATEDARGPQEPDREGARAPVDREAAGQAPGGAPDQAPGAPEAGEPAVEDGEGEAEVPRTAANVDRTLPVTRARKRARSLCDDEDEDIRPRKRLRTRESSLPAPSITRNHTHPRGNPPTIPLRSRRLPTSSSSEEEPAFRAANPRKRLRLALDPPEDDPERVNRLCLRPEGNQSFSPPTNRRRNSLPTIRVGHPAPPERLSRSCPTTPTMPSVPAARSSTCKTP